MCMYLKTTKGEYVKLQITEYTNSKGEQGILLSNMIHLLHKLL